MRRAAEPGTFTFSVLDNGVISEEFWRIVDAPDDLSWGLFYYRYHVQPRQLIAASMPHHARHAFLMPLLADSTVLQQPQNCCREVLSVSGPGACPLACPPFTLCELFVPVELPRPQGKHTRGLCWSRPTGHGRQRSSRAGSRKPWRSAESRGGSSTQWTTSSARIPLWASRRTPQSSPHSSQGPEGVRIHRLQKEEGQKEAVPR